MAHLGSFTPVPPLQKMGICAGHFGSFSSYDIVASRPGGQVAWQHWYVLGGTQSCPSAEAQQAITVWSVQHNGWQQSTCGQICGEP